MRTAVDCADCRSLDDRSDPNDVTAKLEVLFSESAQETRDFFWSRAVERCRTCSTYYEHDYSKDEEDSFVAGIKENETVWRATPLRATRLLRDAGLDDELARLEGRRAAITDAFESAVSGGAAAVATTMFHYVVLSLAADLASTDRWDRFATSLLAARDRLVALEAVRSICLLVGETGARLNGGLDPDAQRALRTRWSVHFPELVAKVVEVLDGSEDEPTRIAAMNTLSYAVTYDLPLTSVLPDLRRVGRALVGASPRRDHDAGERFVQLVVDLDAFDFVLPDLAEAGTDTRRTVTRARIRNALAARHASFATKLRARLARDTALSAEELAALVGDGGAR